MKNSYPILILLIYVLLGCGNPNIESSIIGDWSMAHNDSDSSALTFSFINSNVAYINPGFGQHLNYSITGDTLQLYRELNDSTTVELIYNVSRISHSKLKLVYIQSANTSKMMLHPTYTKFINQEELAFKKLRRQNRIVYDNIAYYYINDFWSQSEYFIEINNRDVFIMHQAKLPVADGTYRSTLNEAEFQTIKRLVSQIKREDLSFRPTSEFVDLSMSGVYISRNDTKVKNRTYLIDQLPTELQALYRYLENLHHFMELIPDSTYSFDTPLYDHYSQLKNFPQPPSFPY